MIGIYGNKQTMPESQKKELFSAGITYMVSGEYACLLLFHAGRKV